jgi:hypothetical protein
MLWGITCYKCYYICFIQIYDKPVSSTPFIHTSEYYVLYSTEIIGFLLEIITLISVANIMGFDNVFIIGGRSFMYILKSKDPKIDPWGTPCFIFPSLKKNTECY